MEKQLTPNQIWVLDELRRQHCPFLASATEQAWKKGNTYYIDKRVSVRGIRRKFSQGNKEAVQSN